MSSALLLLLVLGCAVLRTVKDPVGPTIGRRTNPGFAGDSTIGGQQSDTAALMEDRLPFGDWWGARGFGLIACKQGMHLVPSVANLFMKLRCCWKNAPIRIGLHETENVKVVLVDERAEKTTLWV